VCVSEKERGCPACSIRRLASDAASGNRPNASFILRFLLTHSRCSHLTFFPCDFYSWKGSARLFVNARCAGSDERRRLFIFLLVATGWVLCPCADVSLGVIFVCSFESRGDLSFFMSAGHVRRDVKIEAAVITRFRINCDSRE
jgi:hypothetical protein